MNNNNNNEKICIICTNKARYRCPKEQCQKWSCSVNCVKKHKELYKCNGKRDRVAYVAINDFGDRQLLSDYNYLEEAAQLVDSSNRNQLTSKQSKVTKAEKILLNKCKQVKNINLLRLPKGMSKRQKNRTVYLRKQGIIRWYIHVNFIECNKIVDDRFDETQTWRQIIDKFLTPSLGNAKLIASLRKYLKYDRDSLIILRKVECLPANVNKYYQFDLDETLQSSLAYSTIVEFPMVLVLCKNVFEENKNQYCIIDKEITNDNDESMVDEIKKKRKINHEET